MAAGQVAADAGVGLEQRFGVAPIRCGALALEPGQFVRDPGERPLAARDVAGGLVQVATDDEAAQVAVRFDD